MTTGKTIALIRWTFVGKVISLLFNMLSRLVITFLPRSKCLLISWLQSPSAVILEPPPNKVWHCFHCFPIYFPWSDGTRCIEEAKYSSPNDFTTWEDKWCLLQTSPFCIQYFLAITWSRWELQIGEWHTLSWVFLYVCSCSLHRY